MDNDSILKMLNTFSTPGVSSDQGRAKKSSCAHAKGWAKKWFAYIFKPIHPHSNFCFRWNIVVMALTIYTAIILPCRIGYATVPGPVNTAIDYVAELVFVSDVYLSFRFGYVLPQKQGHGIEMGRPGIFKHYINTWCIPDVAASIPIDFITIATGLPMNSYGFMKVLRMLKLFRLVRLLHLKSLERLEKEGGNLQASMIRLVKLLVAFFFTIHFMSCAYWVMRRQEIAAGSTLWTAADSAEGDDEASTPFMSRYSQGCYWALLVIIGSDTAPASQTQRFFTIASLIVGVCIFSLIIGAASSLLVTLDAHAAARQEQIDSITHFMVFRKVPRDLQRKVVEYYDFLWVTGQSNYHKNLFSELSESLSVQLEIVLKRQMISDTLLFHDCTRTTILAVMRCLETVVVSPEEMVLRQGDVGNAMYFVGFGELRVKVRGGDGLEMVLNAIHQGDHFGEIALLRKDHSTRTVNIQAVTFCQLDMLMRDDFDVIVEACPDFSEKLEKYAQQRLDRSCNAETTITMVHRVKERWRGKVKDAEQLRNAARKNSNRKKAGFANVFTKRDVARGRALTDGGGEMDSGGEANRQTVSSSGRVHPEDNSSTESPGSSARRLLRLKDPSEQRTTRRSQIKKGPKLETQTSMISALVSEAQFQSSKESSYVSPDVVSPEQTLRSRLAVTGAGPHKSSASMGQGGAMEDGRAKCQRESVKNNTEKS
jgi:CRP-like cAMP-binding protein